MNMQFVLLRAESQLVLTTLVRSANSLKLDQVDHILSHLVPGSAILLMVHNGIHLMEALSLQDQQESHKLLVVSYTRQLLVMARLLLVDQNTTHQMGSTVV